MTHFDLSILEELGLKRCASFTYLRYRFSPASRSNLSKRLKTMADDGVLGRKVVLEPLTQRIEFVYFLTRPGAKELITCSTKFASIDEIDTPQNYSTLTHDLAVNWFGAFIDRDKTKYLEAGWIEKIEWESRRVKIFPAFQGQNFLPDALLTIQMYKQDQPRKFLLEMDNSTENRKVIKHKLRGYQDFLRRNEDSLLVVIVQHSEKRLALILELAYQMKFPKNSIFVCTLPEVNTFGIFANIWTTPDGLFKSYRKGNKTVPVMRFNEISQRDRFCLPL